MTGDKADGFFKKAEDLFVKIFRVVVLIIMTVSLVISVIAGLTGAMKMMSSEKEPAKAASASNKGIEVDDFLKSLTPEDPAKPKPEPAPGGGKEETSKLDALKYLAEATKIYGCATTLTAKVGTQTEGGPDEIRKAVEFLRSEVQRLASAEWRGQEWVTSLTAFACAVTQNDKVIKLVSEKGQKVLIPAINFHVRVWDRLDKEHKAHAAKEEERIAKERIKEQMRVVQDKAFALTALIVAGGAFALFMVVALYLIFAKIEANLNLINRSIEEAAKRNTPVT